MIVSILLVLCMALQELGTPLLGQHGLILSLNLDKCKIEPFTFSKEHARH